MRKKPVIIGLIAVWSVICFCNTALADLEVELFSGGILAPMNQWSCGFKLCSDTSQYVKVFFALEVADEFYYFTNHGFDLVSDRLPFGDIYIEASQELKITAFQIHWPSSYQVNYPDYLHFWFWLWVEGSFGEKKRQYL